MTLFNLGLRVCCAVAAMASSNGKLDCISVANWRVIKARSLVLMRGEKKLLRAFLCSFLLCEATTSIGFNCLLRKSVRT